MSLDASPNDGLDAEAPSGYASYLEWKKWDERSFGECSVEDRAYFQELVALAGPPAGNDVCEVGFGNGALLAYLGALGYRMHGVEVQPELVRRAKERGVDAVADISEFSTNLRFDLILLIDVLEHIDQSRVAEFLSSAAARLKPGGRIIARFPNGDSPFGLKNQNGDVTHVTVIGSKKLGYFARRAGLEVLYLGPEPFPLAGGSFSKRIKKAISLPLRHVMRKLLSAFLTLPMDKGFFSQNLVTVLVQADGAKTVRSGVE